MAGHRGPVAQVDVGLNPGEALFLLTRKRAKQSRERRDENRTRLNSVDSEGVDKVSPLGEIFVDKDPTNTPLIY